MPDPVTDLALRLLKQPIDAIPRYRLIRDVLHESPTSRLVDEARTDAMSSPQVAWLANEQQADGSWGHFQRRSSERDEFDTVVAGQSVRQAVRTTDAALLRAACLGMDRQHPVIQRALVYLENLLVGSVGEQDGREPDTGNVAKRDLLIAARIRVFDEENQLAQPIADRWVQLLTDTFVGGTYQELRYLESFESLFGQPAVRDENLPFSGPVLMLVRGLLPYPIEEAYTRHLMEEVRGITGVHHRALHHLPLDFPTLESMRFLAAVELLAAYPSAEPFLEEAKTWLWEQMSPSGRWDLGQVSRDGICLPLSPNWRKPFDREVDSTVRMLLLLQNMQISCDLRQNLCHTR